ncbi:hypothetical protein Nepgr_007845 [Nepenthes gracilis]|uniref:Uncharacterized protein n=1 Tax=Nepenthes gracilis TaxID=150966 RepID=A0AAD3S7Q6_NEPGR|nr:hypothetical protein Nepgr_007845 [Nepenthes gracilis]
MLVWRGWLHAGKKLASLSLCHVDAADIGMALMFCFGALTVSPAGPAAGPGMTIAGMLLCGISTGLKEPFLGLCYLVLYRYCVYCFIGTAPLFLPPLELMLLHSKMLMLIVIELVVRVAEVCPGASLNEAGCCRLPPTLFSIVCIALRLEASSFAVDCIRCTASACGSVRMWMLRLMHLPEQMWDNLFQVALDAKLMKGPDEMRCPELLQQWLGPDIDPCFVSFLLLLMDYIAGCGLLQSSSVEPDLLW